MDKDNYLFMAGGNRHDRDKDRDHQGGSFRRSRYEDTISASGEVGREFANRYGGLFSEKDWKCSICSNINWARRTECNQCKTPKPGLETALGSREGRGGGFLERDEVVEYRQSRDAEKDDEWDEFGRRKKKRQRGTSSNNKDNNDYSTDNNSVVNKNGGEKSSAIPEESNVKEEQKEEEEEEGGDDDRWNAWNDILEKDADIIKKGENASGYNEREVKEESRIDVRHRSSRSRSPYRDRRSRRSRSRSNDRKKTRSRSKDRHRSISHSRERKRSYRSRSRSNSRDRRRRSSYRSRSRSSTRERRR